MNSIFRYGVGGTLASTSKDAGRCTDQVIAVPEYRSVDGSCKR